MVEVLLRDWSHKNGTKGDKEEDIKVKIVLLILKNMKQRK